MRGNESYTSMQRKLQSSPKVLVPLKPPIIMQYKYYKHESMLRLFLVVLQKSGDTSWFNRPYLPLHS